MMKWINAALSILFPPRCAICRKESEEVLCLTCLDQIKFSEKSTPFCSVAEYEGTLRAAIKKFKFKGKKKLAQALGNLLIDYLNLPLSEINMGKIDMLVPVPLHIKRLKKRGFNQAALLAQVISKYYGVPLAENILVRSKNTKPQFDLKKHERHENIKNAFSVRTPDQIKVKRLLLLDDIYTTGSTIIECLKVLKDAGAKRVKVLTLSRAV